MSAQTAIQGTKSVKVLGGTEDGSFSQQGSSNCPTGKSMIFAYRAPLHLAACALPSKHDNRV